MSYLETAIKLYFRQFHRLLPILHQATFDKMQASPFLLLSMCSVGCMYMGRQVEEERGRTLYEKLHSVLTSKVGHTAEFPRFTLLTLLSGL